ncbi:MAG: hypothetical protein KKI08_06480 [Armatimonadetes bacterium]|nr:hypothetical protein [Armatimonadota bacterium]
MRTPLALTSLLITLPLWAQPADLPAPALWVQDDQLQFQGNLKIPTALLEAHHLGMLRALGNGLVLWTVEERDDTENFVQFSFNIANVTTGESRRFFKDLDPFGIGTAWYLQRAQLTPSGRAVLLRVRLSGTGGFVNVYKLMLEPPFYWYELPEETDVWDSASADGLVQARPYWALTADWRSAPTEREARYGTVIVAGQTTPQGRKLWEVPSWRQMPPYAQTDLTSTTVSPDGRHVVFTNPNGLWLVSVRGGEPQPLLPEGLGPIYLYENPVWASDGSGVYVTAYEYSNNDVRNVSLRFVALTAPGQAQLVASNATRLCIPTP